MRPLSNIRIVLVSPIYGGNVGAVCRAMKNMGLRRLVIAAPRSSFDADAARVMACHAADIFRRRIETPTLQEAVADCGLVAGATARGGLYRAHARTPRILAQRLLAAARKTPVALVFGPEDNGLSNDDLAACTQIIRIPSSRAYPALNLSHAVMLCAYELFLASGDVEEPEESSPEAPAVMRERMFVMWREALLSVGFMKEDKADHMMLALRRIFARSPLTEKDIKILVGMARQTRWCGRELEKERSGRSARAKAPRAAAP